MSVVRTGVMNKRVAIQKISSSRGGDGGFTKDFATESTVWANINSLSGQEGTKGDQVKAVGTHRVITRFYSLGVTEADRIKFGTKIFNIVSIINPGERGCNTVFTVKEAGVTDD